MILNVRDGKVIGKRHYYLDSVEDKQHGEILESVIFRYYTENTFIPDYIYMPEEIEDLEVLTKWFEKQTDKKVELIFPKRGEKVQLLQMVRANAQYMLDDLKLQRLKREFIPNSITSLKRDLRLTKLPRRIECFDISNIQGTDTVASMVVFEDGKPKKNDYRKFKIKSALNETGKPDDFASMREVIYRRYIKNAEEMINNNIEVETINTSSKEIMPLPDLIMVDGGKGQLSSAVKVLSDIGITTQNIIGLAKRLEEVYVPEVSEAQSIPKSSSGLRLLQRIRDEAHRFAITYHRTLREKRTIKSELQEIKGIGKLTAQKLLKQFGSVEKIKEAIQNNYSEFETKAGKKTAALLKAAFENN
jgi:excinuclease ABC subunit C